MLSWVSIQGNPLPCIVFVSKHISVSDAQKHLSQQTRSNEADKTFHRTCLLLFEFVKKINSV